MVYNQYNDVPPQLRRHVIIFKGSDKMLPMIYMALVDDEDIPAFEKLYNENKSKAYYCAFDILNNQALAEECVSDAFFAVARNFKKVKELEPHKQVKYIVICCENNARNKMKKEKISTQTEEYDDEEYFTDEGYAEYDMVCWRECLKKLSQTDMEILYLRCVLQLDYKTISKSLGISSEAARARAFAARNNLKAILKKDP